MTPEKALSFLAQAIILRDTAHKLNDEDFRKAVEDVCSYGVMSNRQIAKLTKNRMSHVAVSRFIAKTNKTGGNVNGSDLEKIRAIIFSKSINKTDWKLVGEVLSNGTSFGMFRRLTGISWSTVDRKIKDGCIQPKSTI